MKRTIGSFILVAIITILNHAQSLAEGASCSSYGPLVSIPVTHNFNTGLPYFPIQCYGEECATLSFPVADAQSDPNFVTDCALIPIGTVQVMSTNPNTIAFSNATYIDDNGVSRMLKNPCDFAGL